MPIPYGLRQIIKCARDNLLSRPLYRGIYASLNDVPKTTGYYDADRWNQRSTSNVIRCKQQVGKEIPESLGMSKCLLPLVVSMMKGPLRILDFGGAAGLDFANLLAQATEALDISYHVVDRPGVAAAGRQIWDSPRISFSHDLPDGKFDLIYSYSSVQYVDDFRALLKRFAAYEPAAMLFCKHPIHEGPTFARCQVNMGRGDEVAAWVLNIREISSILAECGYLLAFRGWSEDLCNVDNYNDPYRAGRTANLLFRPQSK